MKSTEIVLRYEFLKKEAEAKKNKNLLELYEATLDVLHDYTQVTKDLSRLQQKHEMAAEPVQKGDSLFLCPDCNHKVSFGHTYCHWCGKKIRWKKAPTGISKKKKEKQ